MDEKNFGTAGPAADRTVASQCQSEGADQKEIDALAQFIRKVDGNNSLGADALAEKIFGWLCRNYELSALAEEFDAAPQGHAWEPPHPIFAMAADVDRLNAANAELLASLKAVSLALLHTNPTGAARFDLNRARSLLAKAGAA